MPTSKPRRTITFEDIEIKMLSDIAQVRGVSEPRAIGQLIREEYERLKRKNKRIATGG